MRNLLAACCFVLFGSLVSLPAQAQAPATVKLCNGGQPNCPVISSTNPLPVSGSFSASLGGFHWSASLPPMTNLGGSPVTQAITAGQTIVIQNIGTTNSAFCALGGTTSANATAIPPNSSYSLTSIAETSITCVTPTSTTTLNLQTGTGLWTNAGGGSTGGSGGAVTLASTADVTEGGITDTACPASGNATVMGCVRSIAQGVTTPLNNSSIPINISTATTTQLVALSGSTAIYVTSYDVIAGGTGNITFEYGTGTACATGTTVLTGAYPLTAQAGIAKGDGIGTVLKVPAGNALCALTSAGVQMSGSLSFQQF